MNVDAYLERIGATRSSSLRELHVQHQQTVPFENLDIWRGVPLHLETPELFDKVVTRRRGGFCYELNGLFGLLLEELGFHVQRLSARVFHDDGTEGPPFDHLALLVDGEWLCDVGFGDAFREPLKFAVGLEQSIGGRQFRLDPRDAELILRAQEGDSDWEEVYSIDRTDRAMDEFHEMFVYHSTSPESTFARGPVCTLTTPDGRITTTEDRLVETAGSEKTVTDLSPGQLRQVLTERFGVHLPD